jgi:hypothetical protein
LFSWKRDPPKATEPPAQLIRNPRERTASPVKDRPVTADIPALKLFDDTVAALPEVPEELIAPVKYKRIVRFRVLQVDLEEEVNQYMYPWIKVVSQGKKSKFYNHGDVRFKQIVSIAVERYKFNSQLRFLSLKNNFII